MFKTSDEGLYWYPASNGLPPPHWHNQAEMLVVNPFAPNVILFSRWNELIPGYRSSDGGETWEPIDVGQDSGSITDLAFSPDVSGTVYATSMGGVDSWVSAPMAVQRGRLCARVRVIMQSL